MEAVEHFDAYLHSQRRESDEVKALPWSAASVASSRITDIRMIGDGPRLRIAK
jgi:hypothetical protein